MLDQIRPCLLPTAQVRRRSDGTDGIYDPESGHSFETTPEQANLINLFDGKRTLLEISAEYMNRYGFVPFAAIDELMWGLADNGLLMHPPQNIERLSMVDRTTWIDLITPSARARWKTGWPGILRVLELLIWPAVAVWVLLTFPRLELQPLDVALFYPGLMLGFFMRERFKAAACAGLGFNPSRAQLVSMLGLVWFVAPETALVTMMDRRSRFLANLAALLGGICATVIAWPWRGVWGGALLVLLFDLCPLVTSSLDSIFQVITRQPHLREQLRTYVGVPLLRSVFTFDVKRAGKPLFFTGLFGLAWLGALFYVIFGLGLSTAGQLLELVGHIKGPMQVLAGGGAMALVAICPMPLVLTSFQFIESAFSVLWPSTEGGKTSGGAVSIEAFRDIPLFSALSDHELKSIADQAREVTYGAGERIVEEGSPGNTFCSIRRGSVVVTRGEISQSPRIVARLGKGDCFGETAIIKNEVRMATVRAVTETVLIELDSKAFEKVVASIGGVEFMVVLRAASAIGKSKLFRELPPERLSSLASKFVPRSVKAGTNVITMGETGHEFFLIARGQVDVLIKPPGAEEEKKVATLADGEHFGEIALLRNIPRTATVRTTADTLLLVLGRETFLQALQADLALSGRVEEIAAARTPQLPGVPPIQPQQS
ncbi:MAG: cyclic nucleotide-binding domain-containing protein [Myxococcaceae bacterium]